MAHYAKGVMPDLQEYLWNLCLIKYELDIYVFVSLNCLRSFSVSQRKWLAYFLLTNRNGETHANKHFSSRNIDGIFHILDKIELK